MQDLDPQTEIISQFCIPKFCNSDKLVLGEDKLAIEKSGIHLVSLNFGLLQKEYISIEMDLS